MYWIPSTHSPEPNSIASRITRPRTARTLRPPWKRGRRPVSSSVDRDAHSGTDTLRGRGPPANTSITCAPGDSRRQGGKTGVRVTAIPSMTCDGVECMLIQSLSPICRRRHREIAQVFGHRSRNRGSPRFAGAADWDRFLVFVLIQMPRTRVTGCRVGGLQNCAARTGSHRQECDQEFAAPSKRGVSP